jgi:hypothetical protein
MEDSQQSVTVKSSRKKKRKRFSKRNYEGDIGKVEIQMRSIKKNKRKKHKVTNEACDYLFSCLSKGKVISLMSMKKTCEENKIFRKKIV